MTVRVKGLQGGKRFNNVTDVRHEVFRIYHAVRHGRMDSLDGLRRVKILETGATMMMESEAERMARELAGRIEQVRQGLIERGINLPAIIEHPPMKTVN